MKKQYNLHISERKAVPRSKRMRENGQVASSAAVFVTGNSGGSGTGNGAATGLSRDIRVNSPSVGNIMTGSVLSSGMGYEQIFRKMLYSPTPATLIGKLSTSNDVEFGSPKGSLSYIATRNDNGPMSKAFYDDIEENALVFSEETNGVQTAVRQLAGNYVKGETYTATVIFDASEDGEINETILNNKISVNVKRKWFAGVCSSIPQTSAEVRALASNGLYNGTGTYKFSTDQWKIVVVCIPVDNVKEISIASSYGNFIENGKVCSGPVLVSVEGANGSEAIKYKMWIIQTQGLNDPDTFTFKTA